MISYLKKLSLVDKLKKRNIVICCFARDVLDIKLEDKFIKSYIKELAELTDLKQSEVVKIVKEMLKNLKEL